MNIRRFHIPVTTASDGSATVYAPSDASTLAHGGTGQAINGRILAIRYVKNNFDNGHGITVTLEGTGEAVLTKTSLDATATFYPRVGVNGAEDGAAATLDGTRLNRDYVHAAHDRVKIVVASGGNAKTGTYIVVVGE